MLSLVDAVVLLHASVRGLLWDVEGQRRTALLRRLQLINFWDHRLASHIFYSVLNLQTKWLRVYLCLEDRRVLENKGVDKLQILASNFRLQLHGFGLTIPIRGRSFLLKWRSPDRQISFLPKHILSSTWENGRCYNVFEGEYDRTGIQFSVIQSMRNKLYATGIFQCRLILLRLRRFRRTG
jgi:hypothetical protein